MTKPLLLGLPMLAGPVGLWEHPSGPRAWGHVLILCMTAAATYREKKLVREQEEASNVSEEAICVPAGAVALCTGQKEDQLGEKSRARLDLKRYPLEAGDSPVRRMELSIGPCR